MIDKKVKKDVKKDVKKAPARKKREVLVFVENGPDDE